MKYWSIFKILYW